jgi:hypothetical protein
MDVSKTEKLPPPPGIINSIKMGFDIIATHISAILLPLLLNLFLWLGPRLRMDALFNSVKPDVISIWKTGGISAEDVQKAMDLYESMIPRINLFWIFHTIPIGISSLFLPQGTSQTPFGNPTILQVSAASLFGWLFILTLLGWIGGGLYFRSVAWLAMENMEAAQPLHISHAIIQTILISIVWGILSVVVGLPVFFILSLVLQFNAVVANIIVLVLSLASMWVIVPLFFWPHGVFIKGQNVITSILSSVQMMRFTLPTSSMFVLMVFLLTFGLNFLWSIPPEDSWMMLLGIFGQSFVTTALLAASFIYYRDMNIWLQVVTEKLRSISALKRT